MACRLFGRCSWVLAALPAFSLATLSTAQSIQLYGSLGQPLRGDVTSFLVTPDGARVVYRADQDFDDVFELFSVPADRSSAPVRLNDPLGARADVNDFAISSGGRVVFRSTAGFAELFSVPADGSASPVHLDDGVSVEQFWLGADGTFVVYRVDQELFRVPIDGSGAPESVAPGHDLGAALLSPDREWAVFEVDSNEGGLPHELLHSVPTDGSTAPILIASSGDWAVFVDESSIEDLKFSPDSQHVLFQDAVRFDGCPGTALTSVRLDGTAGERLQTDHTGFASFDTGISPQGRVVYSVDEELFSVELDGSQPAQLDPPGWFLQEAINPIFADKFRISGDGASVVFQAHDAPFSGGNRALFGVSIDGGPAVELASPGEPVPTSGDFQVHSSVVVYIAAPPQAGLYAVPLAGGAPPEQLAPRPRDFVFHPDGEQVVFRAASFLGDVIELFVVPVDASSPPEQLSGAMIAPGDVTTFLITPDGTRAVYQADQEHDEVFELYGALVDGGGPNVKYNDPLSPVPPLGDLLR